MAGKVKNYLKDFKEITAPLNWKSSPDSPETQLAYVTQPEIDLLVKANLHGSMKGKPNVGPEGIMSLDGLGEEDKAYDEAVDKSGNEAAIDSYFHHTGGGGGDNNNTSDNIIDNVSKWQDENKDNEDVWTGQDIDETTQNQATAEGIALSRPTKEEEKKKSWYEKLWSGISGPDISDPLDQAKIDLIKKAVENWKVNHPNYFEGPPGSLNWLTGIMDSISMGKYRDDDKGLNIGSLEAAEGDYPGSFTREGLDDFIRSIDPDANILGQLQRHNPQLYYSFNDPQTSGGIADLAGQKTIDTEGMDRNSEEYKQAAAYNNQIFAARETAQRDRASDNQGYGGGSGGGGPTDPTDPTDPADPPPGSGNQFAVAPEGKIGFTSDNIDPLTGLPLGYQWGNFADYVPQTEVNLQDMSFNNPLKFNAYNPLAGYVYNNGGIVGLNHGGYLNDYEAADSLMFNDPQEKEEWEYNV